MKLGILVKDVVVYGATDLVTKLLAFIALPLLAAALAPAAYGSLELVMTMVGLCGLLVNFGLNNAVQRFYWDEAVIAHDRTTLVATGLVAQLILGCVAALVGLLALAWWNADAVWLPALGWPGQIAAVALIALTQWNQYALDVLRLQFAPWRFLVASMTSRVGGTAAALWVVLGLGLGLDALLVAQALVAALALPLGLAMIRKDLALKFSSDLARELLRFGHPFIYAGLAYWLLTSMDRWMLAAMSSVEEVGVYSVASRYASVMLLLSGAFGQAWSPVSMRLRTEQPEHYRYLYGQILQTLLALMMAVGVGLALFAGEIVNLTLPPAYAGAAMPMAVLALGLVLQSTNQVTASGISIARATYIFARLMWITALINFVLNLLLIPALGATGAALATTVAYALLSALYLIVGQRVHPIVVPWRALAALLGLGAVLAAVGLSTVASKPEATSMMLKALALVLGLGLGFKLIPWRSLNHA